MISKAAGRAGVVLQFAISVTEVAPVSGSNGPW